MPSIDVCPDEGKAPDCSSSLDEFGDPYTLFPEEAEAVRVLYTQAKQHNIKVHSIFELAQMGKKIWFDLSICLWRWEI